MATGAGAVVAGADAGANVPACVAAPAFNPAAAAAAAAGVDAGAGTFAAAGAIASACVAAPDFDPAAAAAAAGVAAGAAAGAAAAAGGARADAATDKCGADGFVDVWSGAAGVGNFCAAADGTAPDSDISTNPTYAGFAAAMDASALADGLNVAATFVLAGAGVAEQLSSSFALGDAKTQEYEGGGW